MLWGNMETFCLIVNSAILHIPSIDRPRTTGDIYALPSIVLPCRRFPIFCRMHIRSLLPATNKNPDTALGRCRDCLSQLLRWALLQKQEFFCLSKVISLQSIEIDTAGQFARIKLHAIFPGLPVIVYQVRHFLAEDIIYFQAYL